MEDQNEVFGSASWNFLATEAPTNFLFEKLRKFSDFQLWIVNVNVTLFCLTLFVFLPICYTTLTDPKMELFPIQPTDPSLWYMYAGNGFMLLINICGIVGACFFKPRIITVFWWSMVAMVIADIIVGVYWAFRLRDIHHGYEAFLTNIWQTYTKETQDPKFCFLWNSVQKSLECCGAPLNSKDYMDLDTFCEENLSLNETFLMPASCCSLEFTSDCYPEVIFENQCKYSFLRWMYDETQKFFFVGYCLLFGIKLIFVAAMRTEMTELMDHLAVTIDPCHPKLSLWQSPESVKPYRSMSGPTPTIIIERIVAESEREDLKEDLGLESEYSAADHEKGEEMGIDNPAADLDPHEDIMTKNVKGSK